MDNSVSFLSTTATRFIALGAMTSCECDVLPADQFTTTLRYHGATCTIVARRRTRQAALPRPTCTLPSPPARVPSVVLNEYICAYKAPYKEENLLNKALFLSFLPLQGAQRHT
jgi:hypothetical protein